MISITNFTQLIAPDVVGCPNKLIETIVQNVIFKFCTDAWVLQRGIGAVISDVDDEMNNEASIDLSTLANDDLIPVGIVSLTINDEVVTLSRLQSLTHADQLADEEDLKYYYFDGDDNYNLVIYPVVDADEIYMLLAVAPKLSATSVDSTLYDTWCDAIVTGAKYHLLRMPQKVWSDLNAALLMQKDYNRFVTDARRRIRKAYAKQDLSVNPRSDEIWF
jgi:hypothetical protein